MPLISRAAKGASLTWAELDYNFNYLNALILAGIPANMNGGTINATPVGATTPSTGAFTTLALTGSGGVITGDFSNATIASRVMFQTSTPNSQTSIGVLPNGTGTTANLNLFGGSDLTNTSIAQYVNTSTEVRLNAGIVGAGSYLPMTFYTGGSERMRISQSLTQVGIGTPALSTYLSTANGLVVNNDQTLGLAADNTVLKLRSANRSAAIICDYSAGGSLQGYYLGTLVSFLGLDSVGNITLNTPGGGLGYGTGAGGTVTQATSRTTSVTINKPTGYITMFSAVGSASWQAFTVNNSLVTVNDTVITSIRVGATNIYSIIVGGVAAGSFVIYFNAVSGTATDTPVINFAIIKGAVA